MSEFFERPMSWGSPAPDHIDDFKELLSQREVKYFDVVQFEDIIDHFLNSGEFSLAEKAIRMGMSQHPNATAILLRKAEYLFHEYELEGAKKILDQLALMEPSNHDIYITLSAVLSRAKDHEGAIAQLNRVLELIDPFEADHIWEAMGYEYMTLEQFHKALPCFKNALQLRPEKSDLMEKIYDIYVNERSFEIGLDFFVQLSDKDPYSKNVWYYIASFQFSKQEFKEAKFSAELCLAIDDAYADAYMIRGKCCYELKQYDEAISNFKSYLNYTRVTAQILTKIGECYELKGNTKYATFYYQKAIALDPKCGDAHLGLGIVHNMEGDHGSALQSIEKAIALNPKQNEYWHFLGLCYGKERNLEKAINSFEKSLELDEDHKVAWLDLIDLLKEHHEFDNGLEVINKAWQIFPNDKDLTIRKMAFLFAAGSRNRALNVLEKALFKENISFADILKYYPPIQEIVEVKEMLELYS